MDDGAGAFGELDDRAFLEFSIWYEGVEGSWEQSLVRVATIWDSNSETWSSCIFWSEWLEWKNLQKWLKMYSTRQQRRYRIFCQGCLHYAGKTLRVRGNKRVSIWQFCLCIYTYMYIYIYILLYEWHTTMPYVQWNCSKQKSRMYNSDRKTIDFDFF